MVFCNRTGIEDDLVYAGTSSVIGIQDGEVNVYGILGRSVKDVLVVDTDNGPFAKLVQRSENDGEKPSQVVCGTSKASNPPRADSSTPKTTEPEAKMHPTSRQRRPSPTPMISKSSKKTKPKSPKIMIPESRQYAPQFSSHNLSIDESPGIATPTCPSPTPLDQRPKLTSPSPGPPVHNVDMSSGSRVSVYPPTFHDASPSSGLVPDKYFRSTSQRPLRSPMESRFPHVYPPASPAVKSPVAGSLVSVHSRRTDGGRSISGSKRQSPAPDMSQRKESEAFVHGNEEKDPNSEDDQTQNVLPPRPSSPKSRNASRTGRSTYDRRASETHRPNMSELGQRLESIVRRPGSAMDSKGNESEDLRQGRGRARQDGNVRPVGTPLSGDETTFNVSSEEVPFAASPGVVGETILRSQSDLFKNCENNFGRVAGRTGSVQSSGWAGAESHPRPGSTSLLRREAQPNIEPDETRTLVWGELSKMVGEVLSQPREASRGRRQESIPPVPPRVTSTESCSRNGSSPYSGTGFEQRLHSRDGQRSTDQKPMRTIMALDGANVPLDPDDEIVAEIIFHSHAQTQKSNLARVSNPASPEIVQKGISRRDQSTNSLERSRNHTPRASRKGTMHPMTVEGKRPSPQDLFSEIRVYKESTPFKTKARPGSGDSCPNMDGASVHTITTPVRSPSTPSPRVFEPKTPKAMKLGSDFALLTSVSDQLPSEEFPSLDCIHGDTTSIRYPKAKSTGW